MANKIIDSLTYGSDNYTFSTPYGTCESLAASAAKVVTCANFLSLETGARVAVKFTYTNIASAPTLNVNNTGAKIISCTGFALTNAWNANSIIEFVYDGNNWCIVGYLPDDVLTEDSLTTAIGNALDQAKNSGDFDGADGVGIASINKTSSNGLVDTYEINYTDSQKQKTVFTVTNGAQGPRGEGFSIAKTYSSVAEMNADFNNESIPLNSFVLIDTGNVNDEDNAKLYIKRESEYSFLTDLSGAQGIKGVGVQSAEINDAGKLVITLTDGTSNTLGKVVGAAGGFGTPTATITNTSGTPSVSVSASGPDTAKIFSFAFSNLKGEPGKDGVLTTNQENLLNKLSNWYDSARSPRVWENYSDMATYAESIGEENSTAYLGEKLTLIVDGEVSTYTIINENGSLKMDPKFSYDSSSGTLNIITKNN